VEDQAGRKGHRLDRDELVGNEATEYPANDREGDVREALDLPGRCDVGAASRQGVTDFLQNLCCLVLEELGHRLPLVTIEATKQAGAAPLLDEASTLCPDVPLANAGGQLFHREELHCCSLRILSSWVNVTCSASALADACELRPPLHVSTLVE